jgi:hypothetical protein
MVQRSQGTVNAMSHGLKIQIVTPYRVSHLQRYGVTVRGKVTDVYPPSHREVPVPLKYICFELRNQKCRI